MTQHVQRREDPKGHGIWGGVKESEGRAPGEFGGQENRGERARWYFSYLSKLPCEGMLHCAGDPGVVLSGLIQMKAPRSDSMMVHHYMLL